MPSYIKKLQKDFNITVRLTDNSKWDIEKFYWLQKLKHWYYFTFDDDLVYCPYYVKYLISKINEYNKWAIVWLHWVKMFKEIDNYYNSREVYHFNKWINFDIQVNILWTWTIGFHTDTIELCPEKWDNINMSDIYVGIEAQYSWIKMICIKHDWNEIIEDKILPWIWSKNRLNCDKQTELCKTIDWINRNFKKDINKQIVKKDSTNYIKILRDWELISIRKRSMKRTDILFSN